MRKTIKTLFAAAALLSFNAGNQAAEITDWGFVVSANDRSGPGLVRDLVQNFTVENPYQDILTGQLSDEHFATSDLNIAWLNNVGFFMHQFSNSVPSFDRTSQHAALLTLQTDIDLLLDVSGTFNYASSSGEEARFSFSFDVENQVTGIELFDVFEVGGDAQFGEPPSGSFSFEENNILLSAGTYEIGNSVRNFDPVFPDALPNTTDGFLAFNFRPVPEPHTALLLLFGTAATIHRRPRRKLSCDRRAPSSPTP